MPVKERWHLCQSERDTVQKLWASPASSVTDIHPWIFYSNHAISKTLSSWTIRKQHRTELNREKINKTVLQGLTTVDVILLPRMWVTLSLTMIVLLCNAAAGCNLISRRRCEFLKLVNYWFINLLNAIQLEFGCSYLLLRLLYSTGSCALIVSFLPLINEYFQRQFNCERGNEKAPTLFLRMRHSNVWPICL